MKPVVMGHKGGWVWMWRKNTEKRVFSGKIGLPGLWCNEQNYQFFASKFLFKCKFLFWIFDGGIRTCSGWAGQFWKWSEVKKVALLGYSGLSRHWCKEHKTTILSTKTSRPLKSFRCRPWSKSYDLYFWWNKISKIEKKQK